MAEALKCMHDGEMEALLAEEQYDFVIMEQEPQAPPSPMYSEKKRRHSEQHPQQQHTESLGGSFGRPEDVSQEGEGDGPDEFGNDDGATDLPATDEDHNKYNQPENSSHEFSKSQRQTGPSQPLDHQDCGRNDSGCAFQQERRETSDQNNGNQRTTSADQIQNEHSYEYEPYGDDAYGGGAFNEDNTEEETAKDGEINSDYAQPSQKQQQRPSHFQQKHDAIYGLADFLSENLRAPQNSHVSIAGEPRIFNGSTQPNGGAVTPGFGTTSSSKEPTVSISDDFEPNPIYSFDIQNNSGAHDDLESKRLSEAQDGSEVIDLLDSDEEAEISSPAVKRQRTDAAIEAFQARSAHIPDWMNEQSARGSGATSMIVPGASIRASALVPRQTATTLQQFYGSGKSSTDIRSSAMPPITQQANLYQPEYLRLPEGFVPTWKQFLPGFAFERTREPLPPRSSSGQVRRFKLSLLNVNEFTIEGLPIYGESGPRTPVAGLRVPIRKFSRNYGKAVFDQTKNPEDEDEATAGEKRAFSEGKWRIPLGAYNQFVSYLVSCPLTHVEGIPNYQFQIASVERVRQAKGYPSVEAICNIGVPKGLAKALAPFQRGGVDFVNAKAGRALLADEMGLGKTVQSIASMSMYVDEWPLLILTPSTARYHWESELERWLGVDSPINKQNDTPRSRLIRKSQIHVLTSSKDPVIPNRNTRVVICSYGLAPALAESGNMKPGQFGCAIVDESHMLKNKATKRTALLTPILKATKRCVLLSGTPAMAQPYELWPQLDIIGTTQHGWWDDETGFVQKYVKKPTSTTRAELHALLTGTVMIRRLKSSILKSMKPKIRQKAQLTVVNPGNQAEFKYLIAQLSRGKGQLAKIARTKDMKTIQADVQREVKEDPDLEPHGMFQDESEHSCDDEEDSQADRSEKSKRANILSRLYSLTAEVKIPVIAQMLNKWLDDPTKGKVCIFAHHLIVLDSLRDICRLSNDPSSRRKYMRIDGSTLPKPRQDQINRFQNDPSVRIALLGITAAGVAVTLTASSTVWFAELFWTPAIMIQAEDRCHRIGQQGQVECVYFVGRGTLDDLLWKLVEKKLQDLGEFVEGKEKEKMVIHKVWKNTKEFLSIFESKDSMNSEEEGDHGLDDMGQELVPLDANLEHDIEELGEYETRMIKNFDADDDEGESNSATNEEGDAKPEARTRPNTPLNEAGCSEDAAITLSDDEEDETAGQKTTAIQTRARAGGDQPELFDKPLVGCRLFRVVFQGTSLGLEIMMVTGRAVVAGLNEQRVRQFGYDSKPAVGDVLVMVGNVLLPLLPNDNTGITIQSIISKASQGQAGVHVVFAEHEELRGFAIEVMSKRLIRRIKNRKQLQYAPEPGSMPLSSSGAPSEPSSSGIIEIE